MIYKRDIRHSLQKTSIFIFLLLHTIGTPLHAAETGKDIALEIYPQWYSNEDSIVQGSVGIEKDVQNNDWVKYYTKPSFAYAMDGHWALHGGVGFYYTDYDSEDNSFEIRPFVGISHFTPLKEKWKLSSYFRAEERLKYNTNTKDKEDTLRLRFRLRTSYQINPISQENSWSRVTFGAEGFRSNTNNNEIQDSYDYETRITTGLERRLQDNQKIRFALTWKYKGKPSHISQSSVSTFYFRIQYFPVWGETFAHKLFNRDIEE